ncbi:MAG: segregation/condensation protein A [Myxococcota bacterium]
MSRKQQSTAPAPEPVPVTLPEGVKGDFDLEAAKDYTPRQESEHAYLRVELQSFEGPLDLLLHLIKKHALDIFNIPISFITQKFLQVLDAMKAADLDIAAEFLVMAATLAHIKSKTLLPPEEATDVEDEEQGDPRAELVRRLLEYQKYKQAAQDLMARGLLFRDTWPRGRAGAVQEAVEGTRVELTPMDLIATLEELLRQTKVPHSHEVILERVSVGARINEVVELARMRDHFTFETAVMHELVGTPDRMRIIVTLLAILEMARLKLVRVSQPADGGSIYVTTIKENLEVMGDADLTGRDYAG